MNGGKNNTCKRTGQRSRTIMSDQNKLTAEERIEPFFESNAVSFKGEYYVDKAAFYACMKQFAAQQTAEKDERIKELEKENLDWKEAARVLAEGRDARILELEAVKKERDGEALKNENIHLTIARKEQSIDDLNNNYAILKAHRDEAVKLLEEWQKREPDPLNKKFYRIKTDCLRDRDNFLSRLSSGETKPEYVECPDCIAVNRLPKWDYCGLECCCPTCLGKGVIENINPSNNSSSEQE